MLRTLATWAALAVSTAGPLTAQTPTAATPDSTLAALAFLEGRWRIPAGDPALEQSPELAGLDIVDAKWVVGGKAMRWLDHVGPDRPAEAEGLVYWDPALEKIRFVGVGGPAEGVWAADGPDAITHTLEWWHEGRWQPYARGNYRLVRAGSGG